jgi:hypothetical protein
MYSRTKDAAAHQGLVFSLGALGLLALSGCDQLKAKLGKGAGADAANADPSFVAATDAGAVATPAAADPAPKNIASVATFGSENALANVEATVQRAGVRATAAIPSGAEVAMIAQGTVVKQVAEKSGFYRVTFADPKDPASRLVGWVDKTAFIAKNAVPPSAASAAAAKAKKPVTCAAGLLLAGEGEEAQPRCAKPCSDDEDCGGGDCEMAFSFDPKTMKMNALPGARTLVCVGSAPPAKPGAATTADTGVAAATYKVGDAVMVEWKGGWFPARVIAIGNGKYKIHYDGYGSEWDEFVGLSRMKKK